MNNAIHEKIKNKIKDVLSELKPGKSLKRKTVWNIVHSRLLEDDILLLEDIHDIFYSKDDRDLRRLVEQLKVEGLSVGSSPTRGYFQTSSQEDLNESVKDKKAKIYGLFRSIRREKENAERHLGIQLYIESIEDLETQSEEVPAIECDTTTQGTIFNLKYI